MKQYNVFCFDLDGTLFLGDRPIDSAIHLLKQLQQKNKEYFIVTNNSSKTPKQLYQQMLSMGLEIPKERIYSSAFATAKYLSTHFPSGNVHLVGSEGLRYALQSEKIPITEDVHSDAVVMGIDRNINYEKLSKATLAVQKGATLIGTNEDEKYPTEHGFVPGNGSFVNLVAKVAGVQPVFIGKPSPMMLEFIQQEHQFKKEEMLMIGDNYDTDILCGIQFGCDTVHVNTGVTPKHRISQMKQKPTYSVDHLIELDYLL